MLRALPTCRGLAALLASAAIACSLAGAAPAGAAEAGGGAGPGAGAELPPAIAAQLDRDIAATAKALAAERRALLPVVTRQQRAQAAVGRLQAASERLEPLAEVAEAFGGKPLAEEVTAPVEDAAGDATEALDAVTGQLAKATAAAAKAQGAALDATRRRDALARALTQQDTVDPDIGSYRFGSGGPSVSAVTLDRYLEAKASPMAGEGVHFLEAGLRYDIDPRFLVAVSGAESYFGLQTCAAHNAWGWGCPNSPASFPTWEDAINTVAKGLREGYLDDGLVSVGRIHLRYAPPNAANDPTGLNFAWPDNVARFLREQGGDPQDVGGLVRNST